MLPTTKYDTSRTLGLDLSTKSMAFAVLEDDTLSAYGKLYIEGNTIWDRAAIANRNTYALLKITKPSHVAVESAVFVNNRSVVIKLAYVYGSVAGVIGAKGYTMTEVSPLTWGAYIGNPVNNKTQKALLKREFPGKTESWLKSEARRRRKQFTMDWVYSEYGIRLEDDDIADAVAVAFYALENN
jgi:Holliday junction resolvasome RuvABC endonuclease subunit